MKKLFLPLLMITAMVNGKTFAQCGDCDDSNLCTYDYCDIAGLVCLPATCCHDTIRTDCVCFPLACDDGIACTVDSCANRACQHANPCCAGTDPCCGVDCFDNNPCTDDGCIGGLCPHSLSPGCCIIAADCPDDGDVCTEAACSDSVCTAVVVTTCCFQDEDCGEDGDVCTLETCSGNRCDTLLIINCQICSQDSDCAGDFNLCTIDTCLNSVCAHVAIQGCCLTTADCDDSSPCTADTCVANTCSSVGSCDLTIAGGILSESNAGIAGVTAYLTGSAADSVVTKDDGQYSFDRLPRGSYTVRLSKKNDIAVSNGISTLDIVLMRRQILAIQNLGSPYKILAADVNASGTVTTLDIVLTQGIILGNTTAFPSERLWAFVPNDYAFIDSLNPFPFPDSLTFYVADSLLNQDFIGVKLGDVNNSWDPLTPKQGATGNVQLAMNEYNVKSGDEIIVPVKVKDFKGITGYQFTLSWDAKVLSLREVKNKSLQGFYGENKTSEGILTTSWYDEDGGAVSLDDEANAFELKFKAIGANGTQSAIKFGSELTVSEAYNQNLDLLNIVPTNGMVKVENGNSLNTQNPTPVTLSVQPNPFTNSTNIIFTLPQDETVTLSIYDILGREVRRMKSDYKVGEHQVEWAGDDETGNSLSKGLYHVRMTAGEHTLSTKAVMMR